MKQGQAEQLTWAHIDDRRRYAYTMLVQSFRGRTFLTREEMEAAFLAVRVEDSNVASVLPFEYQRWAVDWGLDQGLIVLTDGLYQVK